MKLFAKSDTLALNTIAGNQSVTGLGFTPKIVFFLSQPDTSNIVGTVANAHFSFGVFDGTRQWVRGGSSRNGVISQSTSEEFFTTGVIGIYDPPGGTVFDYFASAVSLDADGFTINISNPPPINYRFSYLALGGTTLQAYCSTFQSAGGGQFVSTGFTPEAIGFMGSLAFAPLPQSAVGCFLNIGFATKTSFDPSNSAFGFPQANGGVPVAKRYMDTGWPIDVRNTAGTTVLGGGVSVFNPTGFTTAYFANPTGYHVGFFALAGTPDIKFHSSQGLFPSATGVFTYTGVGFTPRAGFFASDGQVPAGGFSDNSTFSFGMYGVSATVNRVVNMYNDFGPTAPTITNHASHDQRIVRFTDSASVITEDMDFQSINTDGFSLNALVASATPSRFGMLLIGDTDPVTPGGPDEDAFGIIV